MEKEIQFKMIKEKTDMSLFKKIHSFFMRKNVVILTDKEKNLSPEYIKKSDFLDNCLSLELFDDILKIRQSGFIFSKSQENLFYEMIRKDFYNNCSGLIKKMEHYNESINENFLLNLISEPKFIKNNISLPNDDIIEQTDDIKNNRLLIIKVLQNPKNKEILVKKWEYYYKIYFSKANDGYYNIENLIENLKNFSHIKDGENFSVFLVNFIYPLIIYPNLILKDKNLDEILTLANKINKVDLTRFAYHKREPICIKDILNVLNIKETDYNNKIIKILSKTVKSFLENEKLIQEKEVIHKSVAISKENLINKVAPIIFDFNNIPNTSKDILKSIESMYQILLEGNLSSVDKDKFKKIWEDSIKTAIIDYLKLSHLSPEFLEKIVNTSGKNANEILENTLSSYQEIFKEQIKIMGEEYLTKISVNDKYATAKKNSI